MPAMPEYFHLLDKHGCREEDNHYKKSLLFLARASALSVLPEDWSDGLCLVNCASVDEFIKVNDLVIVKK